MKMHCDAVEAHRRCCSTAGILPSFLQSFAAVDNRSRVFFKGLSTLGLFTHFRNLIVLSNDQKISTLKF